MPGPGRRGVAVTAWVLAGLVVAGCGGAEDPEGPDGDGTGGGTGGDVPPSLVLPDDLAVSPDGEEVLADCRSGICRWTTDDGQLDVVEGQGHVAVSDDWSSLATVGDDAEVLVRDLDSGAPRAELTGLPDAEVVDGSPVHDVTFSPDGRLVAASGQDGTIVVWEIDGGAEVARLTVDHDADRIEFDPDGELLATAGGGPMEVIDVGGAEVVATLPASSSDVAALAWSPDGAWLAGPGPADDAAVWDTADFTLADRLAGVPLDDVAFAPGSRRVALTSDDDLVRVWSPALGGRRSEVVELRGHRDEPGDVVFAPDGRTLYSVSGAEGVLAWDPDAPRAEPRRFELPER